MTLRALMTRTSQLEEQLRQASKVNSHFPLTQAVMCLNCETVFQEGTTDSCPRCTGGTWVYLSSWIPSVRLREEIDDLRSQK